MGPLKKPQEVLEKPLAEERKTKIILKKSKKDCKNKFLSRIVA